MPDLDKLSTRHKDMLLETLMHYADGDMRARLMSEVPAAYNAWCGREVVSTVLTGDGLVVRDGEWTLEKFESIADKV